MLANILAFGVAPILTLVIIICASWATVELVEGKKQPRQPRRPSQSKQLTRTELDLELFEALSDWHQASAAGARHWEMTSWQIAQTVHRFRTTPSINERPEHGTDQPR